MKKLLLLCFLLFLSFNSFANWEVMGLRDEFQELTGDVRVYVIDNNGGAVGICFLSKGTSESNELELGFVTKEFIGKNEALIIKIKIDNLPPIKLYGYVGQKENMIFSYLNKKNIELFKKGNKLKVVIEKSNGNTIFEEYNITGADKAIKLLK